jgi:hypothetical protein
MYYEGKGLLKGENVRLIGRDAEYNQLDSVAASMISGTTDYTGISISGIGGIGYC